MSHFLFTSESVAIGHPDKIADQISDAILDACLERDIHSRVACETLVSKGLVMLAGEITTRSIFDLEEVVRNTILDIGYDDGNFGFDGKSVAIVSSLQKQSPDIARGIDKEGETYGAGDQGMMFGFACDETPELMPMPIMLAHKLVRELRLLRITNKLPYLRPDAKAQVTVEYENGWKPLRIHTIVISTQHTTEVESAALERDMEKMAKDLFSSQNLIDKNTLFFINPTGRFVIGGPAADTGLTGRKIIVDTYGSMARHGGGAFSGKDPTKVDRSAAYAARYAAKNIIAAGLAKRCELQLSYAIGIAKPISIKVDTFGTGIVPDEHLSKIISLVFDFSPKGIIDMLDLRRPIYKMTAFGGHFGRHEEEFTWEKTDRIRELQSALQQPTLSTQPLKD